MKSLYLHSQTWIVLSKLMYSMSKARRIDQIEIEYLKAVVYVNDPGKSVINKNIFFFGMHCTD